MHGSICGRRVRTLLALHRNISVFESRILTGAVINSKHIEPRQFLEDVSEIVLKRVHSVHSVHSMQRYDSIKINIVFNSEFVADDKRTNKSIATRNYINISICVSGTCRIYSSITGRVSGMRLRMDIIAYTRCTSRRFEKQMAHQCSVKYKDLTLYAILLYHQQVSNAQSDLTEKCLHSIVLLCLI